MREKLKKINPLFAFILSLVVAVGTVYAATTILSSNVGFTSSSSIRIK